MFYFCFKAMKQFGKRKYKIQTAFIEIKHWLTEKISIYNDILKKN